MKSATLAALSLALVLGACGGDDDDDDDNTPPVPPVTSEVPGSASESPGGFITYLIALVASSADTLEPVDTSAVTGPTDDTGQPQVVD